MAASGLTVAHTFFLVGWRLGGRGILAWMVIFFPLIFCALSPPYLFLFECLVMYSFDWM